jgi:hypothetical protein
MEQLGFEYHSIGRGGSEPAKTPKSAAPKSAKAGA